MTMRTRPSRFAAEVSGNEEADEDADEDVNEDADEGANEEANEADNEADRVGVVIVKYRFYCSL